MVRENQALSPVCDDQEHSWTSCRTRTLARSVSLQGRGLHSGQEVSLRLCPSEKGRGICFSRTDLPDSPLIPAHADYVAKTERSTTLAAPPAKVATVEHLLAAIWSVGIEDLIIEVDGPEIPVADGAALAFMNLLEEGGVFEQQQERLPLVSLERPLYVQQGQALLIALPAPELQYSYTLDYPAVAALGTQHYSFVPSREAFREEVAPARSFALWEEIEALRKAGLIQGTSLKSGIVIKGAEVLTEGGLHFANECCRHKVLDMVGDLALIGFKVRAHFLGLRSGHAANVELARRIRKEVAGRRDEQ